MRSFSVEVTGGTVETPDPRRWCKSSEQCRSLDSHFEVILKVLSKKSKSRGRVVAEAAALL